MKPVDQTIVGQGNGDCFRAATASLLEMDIAEVPHFIVEPYYKDAGNYYIGFVYWLNDQGYDSFGCTTNPDHFMNLGKYLTKGAVMCSVPSKTYPDSGTTHAVLINELGDVIHDPNPNKAWMGENVLKVMNYFHIIEKIGEGTDFPLT